MNNSVVSVALCGGLGNQCFQFFTLLAYALKTKRSVILCNESAGTRPTVYWSTVFARLSELQLPKITIVEKFDDYLQKTKSFLHISEKNFYYEPLPTIQEDVNVLLKGYFQSHLYFDGFENTLMNIFLPKNDRIAYLENLWNTIVDKSISKDICVSLHVRRGDYLKFPDIHLAVSKEYYQVAVTLFPINYYFIVFSDDISWCKTVFQTIPNAIFVPETLVDHEAFHLMMFFCCGGHIIANSSFSWWAAYVDWIASKKNRTVVAPETWFGPKGPQKNSLHVPGWIIVQNQK